LHVTAIGIDMLARGQQAIHDADQRLLADVPAEQEEVLTAVLLQAFTAAVHRGRAPANRAAAADA